MPVFPLFSNIQYATNSELLGDLNDDQIVNVLDIILLVNMILDLSPLQFNSDINGDGNVDVLDVIIIVNIIIQTL